jgi:hypothetical protein
VVGVNRFKLISNKVGYQLGFIMESGRLRVYGSGSRVCDLGLRNQDLGYMIQGL